MKKKRKHFSFRFICLIFGCLAIWATIYEQKLLNMQEADNDNSLTSRHPIHSVDTKTPNKTNGQHNIYSFEHETSDLEKETESTIKMNKIHPNNIINGCTFELLPISIENNNGNLTNNNNNRHFYRMNNNNKANNINNNNHNGNNCAAHRRESITKDNNNHHKHIQEHNQIGGTAYATKPIDTYTMNELSKCKWCLFFFFFLLFNVHFYTEDSHRT